MNRSDVMMNNISKVLNILSWLFGIAVFAAGIINSFWGNDPGFGIFLLLLSFVYFPPVNTMITNRIGFKFPVFLKILLAVFIIIATLGVGELFDKIELMRRDM